MKISYLEPEFVELMPEKPEPGKLYISMTFATTLHLCASGCGNKVILPLSPAEWQIYYNGKTVSLSPSIGNWEYPCQSHYWIRKNKIQWAGSWSKEKIETGRLRDQRDLDQYIKYDSIEIPNTKSVSDKQGLRRRLLSLFK